MQMVIPEYFSVNKKGWLAGATYAPLDPKDGDENTDSFDLLSARSKNNQSKFDQPKRMYQQFPHRDYILFPCQIPHDETIKYHSKISVEQALHSVICYCEQTNTKLIVKGHPVNPGSMEPLRLLTLSSSVTEYHTEGSIFDYIEHAKLVCVVNSGTGFESILMNKPVVMFGDAEYDKVVNKADLNNYMDVIATASYDATQYRKFVNRWTTIMYNSNDSISFRKLPSLNTF
jgi:capsule polysaccharide modification protein KpsS